MAQPLGSKERQEKWRENIQSALLLKRLEDNALGIIELSRDQIKSIEILLKKTMPDLKAIEHSGEIKADLNITKVIYEVIDPSDIKT